jgi:hypothetical protein
VTAIGLVVVVLAAAWIVASLGISEREKGGE